MKEFQKSSGPDRPDLKATRGNQVRAAAVAHRNTLRKKIRDLHRRRDPGGGDAAGETRLARGPVPPWRGG